jgi:hypothetical protein
MNVDWTDELVARLKAWIAEGREARWIAAQIPGATKNAVIGKAGRLGVTTGGQAGRPMIRDQNFIDKVLRRREAGKSLLTIAAELGCNVKTVSNVVVNLRKSQRLYKDRTKPLIHRTQRPIGFVPSPLQSTEIEPETTDCAVTFFDLAPHHCRWPISGEKLGISYCGRAKIEDGAYCQHHTRRAASRFLAHGSDS